MYIFCRNEKQSHKVAYVHIFLSQELSVRP
jgi:hypothetical protein